MSAQACELRGRRPDKQEIPNMEAACDRNVETKIAWDRPEIGNSDKIYVIVIANDEREALRLDRGIEAFQHFAKPWGIPNLMVIETGNTVAQVRMPVLNLPDRVKKTTIESGRPGVAFTQDDCAKECAEESCQQCSAAPAERAHNRKTRNPFIGWLSLIRNHQGP